MVKSLTLFSVAALVLAVPVIVYETVEEIVFVTEYIGAASPSASNIGYSTKWPVRNSTSAAPAAAPTAVSNVTVGVSGHPVVSEIGITGSTGSGPGSSTTLVGGVGASPNSPPPRHPGEYNPASQVSGEASPSLATAGVYTKTQAEVSTVSASNGNPAYITTLTYVYTSIITYGAGTQYATLSSGGASSSVATTGTISISGSSTTFSTLSSGGASISETSTGTTSVSSTTLSTLSSGSASSSTTSALSSSFGSSITSDYNGSTSTSSFAPSSSSTFETTSALNYTSFSRAASSNSSIPSITSDVSSTSVSTGSASSSSAITSSQNSTSIASSTATSTTSTSAIPQVTVVPKYMVYSPYEDDQSCRSYDTVVQDLENMKNKGITHVRVYGTDCNAPTVIYPAAKSLGMKIIQGLWIGSSGASNALSQYGELIASTSAEFDWSVYEAIIIGNEDVTNGYITASNLHALVVDITGGLQDNGYPGEVWAAETTGAYINYPDEMCSSDMGKIALNAHSYFAPSFSAQRSGEFILNQIDLVQQACGRTDIFISETGYPWKGNRYGNQVPSKQNQADAVNSILDALDGNAVILAEYDDLWKAPGPYNIEQHFGVLDIIVDLD